MFLWNDAEKRKIAEVEFLKPIIDLICVKGWVLVACEDKLIPLDFETDLQKSQIEGGIAAKIFKRGLVDLYADEFGARIVMPSLEKKGYAHVITIHLNKEKIELSDQKELSLGENFVVEKHVDATRDNKMF